MKRCERPSERLTRQGVRDLNPASFNGHRARGSKTDRCSHQVVKWAVIGYTYDRDMLYEIPVEGERCVQCGKTWSP